MSAKARAAANPDDTPPFKHPRGATILVLGILSLTTLGLLGPFAWVMGSRAEHEIETTSRLCLNSDSVTVGRIRGVVGTGLMALGVTLALVGVQTSIHQLSLP